MQIDDVRALIRSDMQAVDAMILRQLHSEVPLINQIGAYIVQGGGKRLRPMVALLCAGAAGYRGQHHIEAATIVEFIHTATLLHDDVVDESALRRGRDTANAVWGNASSVLVGDFIYSRAFQLMVELGQMRIMQVMADTTNAIAEGEVLQLLNCHDPDVSEARYMEVIHCKTARLFEAAARLGAILSGCDRVTEDQFGHYGMHLGTAFQLVDDILDYRANSETLGKNIGDDLAEGKPTLPLIHLMREGNAEVRTIVRQAIERGEREQVPYIAQAIEASGSLDYTYRIARNESRKAAEILAKFEPSPFVQALHALCTFSVERAS